MRTDIKLGRVFGIEIGLNYSWFLIAFLIVLSVEGDFSSAHKDWSQMLVWSLSVALSPVVFRVSVAA